MNLPVVLDIAIGLVFIYLIASLLASELQELISTLLQWRAKHLRESIQNLLSGEYGTQETDQVRNFIESIYGDPLIKNINQSSRGLLSQLGQMTYRIFYPGKGIFGKRTTAPSYISPETFATALLEQVGMSTLVDKLTEIRLKKFISRIIGLYDSQDFAQESGGIKHSIIIPSDQDFELKDGWEKGGIRVLAEKSRKLSQDQNQAGTDAIAMLTLDNHNRDFVDLVEEYDDVLSDFRSGEADLSTCVERVREGLDNYINQITAKIPSPDAEPAYEAAGLIALSSLERQQLTYFKKRLNTLRSSIFGERSERAISSGRLKPNLLEIAEVFDRTSITYQEIEGAYQDVVAAYLAGSQPDEVKKVLDIIASKVSAAVNSGESGASGADASSTDVFPNAAETTTPTSDSTAAIKPPAIGDPVSLTGDSSSAIAATESAELGEPIGTGESADTAERSGVEIAPIADTLNTGDTIPPVTEIPPFVPASLEAADQPSVQPTTETSPPETAPSQAIEETPPIPTPPAVDPTPPVFSRQAATAIAQTITRITTPLSDDDLLKTEYQPYVDAALNSLSPAEQQTYRRAYKGWLIYQQIVLKVIKTVAKQLQSEERLFNRQDQYLIAQPLPDAKRVYSKNRYVVQPYTDLDARALTSVVKHSLRLMTNEERQIRVNTALNQLSLEQRKIYQNYETYDEIQDFLSQVPTSVKQSLAILARRAQTKIVQTDRQLSLFSNEVSVWFDRSMNRASGVYKRNAKGVAIMIGFLIAFLSNSDTFHIIARLSSDGELRQVVAQRAADVTRQTNASNPENRALTTADLRDLKNKTDAVLQEIALPIQWTPTNLTRQFDCLSTDQQNSKKIEMINRLKKSDSNRWSNFYNACLPPGRVISSEDFDLRLFIEIIFYRPIDAMRVVLGWLVSGVAIAMGAPFWFDILSKIMNVRNTGTKPAPVAEKDGTKTSTS